LRRCNSATDDAELRRVFGTYQAEYDIDVAVDPFSESYRRKQLDMYRQLAGKPYSPANEVTNFDVTSASISPFPYSNGSCELVGNQLMAIGYLIRALNLPKGAKILEFGPGWGNTTIALAKMGFDVTAVDIEKNFCNLVSERARLENLRLNVVNADFSYIHMVDTQYDAILFFECFHHAPDHQALMSDFDKVVKPEGIVCFGSEPITPDFPIPWGLRMDGESIWAIRQNGWLELGFNERYFEDAMYRNGWALTWNRAHDCPWATVVIAKRASELGGIYTASRGHLFSDIGEKNKSGALVATGNSGYLIFGPYIELPKGKYKATFLIETSAPIRGIVDIDVAIDAGTRIINSRTVDLNLEPMGGLNIEFSLAAHSKNVEVRIRCHDGAHLTVSELSIAFLS
jgi:2-polyprenyl-3-methyl-5-hydroxy-6-metoxy-1,4-benzoquinol methylase